MFSVSRSSVGFSDFHMSVPIFDVGDAGAYLHSPSASVSSVFHLSMIGSIVLQCPTIFCVLAMSICLPAPSLSAVRISEFMSISLLLGGIVEVVVVVCLLSPF